MHWIAALLFSIMETIFLSILLFYCECMCKLKLLYNFKKSYVGVGSVYQIIKVSKGNDIVFYKIKKNNKKFFIKFYCKYMSSSFVDIFG